MKKILLALFALTMGITSCVEDAVYVPSEVVIPDSPLKGLLTLNEINGNGLDADKYMELYNNSDEAIDLEGVTISYRNAGTIDYALSWTGVAGQTLAPRDFLLIQGAHDEFDTGLSATQGIFLQLLDSEDKLVDRFSVVAQALRPVDANTTAKSFSRIPDGSGNWYFTPVAGTPGVTNGTVTAGLVQIVQAQAPTITAVSISPASPDPTDPVTVSATVMPVEGTITSVILTYYTSTNATVQTVTMTSSGNVYSAQIPLQADLTFVYYTITAINSAQGIASAGGSYFVADAPLVTDGQIYINEADPIGKRWEFYNPGTSHVDISGWRLVKDNSDLPANIHIFPAGTVIPAGSFTVFTQNIAPGPSFGMSGTGGFRYDLSRPNSASPGTFIPVDTFDNLGANQINQDMAGTYSLGRTTNGGALIRTFSVNTIGATNVGATIAPLVAFGNLVKSPAAPTEGVPVLVTVNLTYGTETAPDLEMVYFIDDVEQAPVAMTRVGTTISYTGTIPAGPTEGQVVEITFQEVGNAASRSTPVTTQAIAATTYTVGAPL